MKLFSLYFFIFLAAIVIQKSVFYFPGASLRVDLVFLLVLYIGFHLPLYQGGWAVLLIGLGMESVSVSQPGVLSLSYLSAYFFLRIFQKNFLFEGAPIQAIWVVFLTLAQKELIAVLMGYPKGFLSPFSLLFLSALQGALAYYLFPRLHRLELLLKRESF